MLSITDSGAIKSLDAREDGVYITYEPSAGADPVTKKLGSDERRIKSISFKQSIFNNHTTASGSGTFTIMYIIDFLYDNNELTGFNVSSSGWGIKGGFSIADRGTSGNGFIQQ